MNANYKNVLDYYVAPERSKNYRDLVCHLFEYGQKHLKIFKRAMESTGFNSFAMRSMPPQRRTRSMR